MRSRMLKAALCVVALGSAATRADAGAGWWAANGAACVPGDPAIQANRYTIGAGSVKHQAGASGLITLYCAVDPGLGGVQCKPAPDGGSICGCDGRYVMRQTYTDSDGHGTAVSVRSALYRMSKENGAIAAIAGAHVHSNAYPETVSTNHTPAFDHGIELHNYYYYVRVDLDRVPGSTESAILYGVAIECR